MHVHFDQAIDSWLDVYRQVLAPHRLKNMDMPAEMMGASIEHHVEYLRENFQHCAKFVFDAYPPDGIEKFGIELLKNDIFSLPYPTCYFQWPFDGGISCLFVRLTDDDKLHLFSARKMSDARWGGGLPFQLSMGKLVTRIRNGEGLVPAEMFNADPRADVHRNSAKTCLEETIACVSMLSAKGVHKEQVQPKASVNRRRAESGKRELPSYTIVHLGKSRSSAPNGRGHASPRPHMRRGHVRQLDEERKTVVRPHFVMADPGALPTYRIPKP